MSFIKELKRRNVFRVGNAYAIEMTMVENINVEREALGLERIDPLTQL